MTLIDNRNTFRPASGEAPFRPDEVFFSRTDNRGVIRSGNYIFHRVAAYEWPEMIGAPHRIIRHPDMPRGVFWLLWDTIKSGRPMGAYVKNRARDGLHYWVYAVVMPQGDGYLSVRIKPTSPLLKVIEAEYDALRHREEKEGLSPAAAAQVFLDRLATLGYPSYLDFSARALSTELSARDTVIDARADTRCQSLLATLEHAVALKSETEGLIADFRAMRTVPHNLQVIASRLEPTGGPISTLSKNYAVMSRDMFDWFETNVVGEKSNFARIKDRVLSAVLIHCMGRILAACDQQLSAERRDLGGIDIEEERQILHASVQRYAAEATEAVTEVKEEAARILSACTIMDRHILALSTTRVMCKIESSRLPTSGESLTDIIQQLKVFQERIRARLDQFVHLGGRIRDRLG
ncbi:PAS domain-containing protein [Maritimibacter sp. DP1N21-5]|uniref:PAS domain-containing protein n=1 Tax=Maritimibacter sp. DP1N21-5 TaxID=2836867 RepID=UPI001C492A83|nr:PAS domain-containing protein [Maritimibacter sp. DP1N21-5]MBV7410178.1 PAS domain-containing protein [Maritimibacter sp. DP1N21-5]